MPTTLTVQITTELVERATQRDSRHCMIAEAIKLGHPHFTHILVDLATIRWTNPRTKNRYVCLTPEAAARALVDFDQGLEIAPFALNISPIQVTPSTRQSRRADGTVAVTRARGRKKFADRTIQGGEPLTTGHLGGGVDEERRKRNADKRTVDRTDSADPTGTESNAVLSSTRYRQYGRRLLRP